MSFEGQSASPFGEFIESPFHERDDGGQIFATYTDEGLRRLIDTGTGVAVLWQYEPTLNCFGFVSNGSKVFCLFKNGADMNLRCLDYSGNLLWETPTETYTAEVGIKCRGSDVWLFVRMNAAPPLDYELRRYDGGDGTLLWTFDQQVQTEGTANAYHAHLCNHNFVVAPDLTTYFLLNYLDTIDLQFPPNANWEVWIKRISADGAELSANQHWHNDLNGGAWGSSGARTANPAFGRDGIWYSPSTGNFFCRVAHGPSGANTRMQMITPGGASVWDTDDQFMSNPTSLREWGGFFWRGRALTGAQVMKMRVSDGVASFITTIPSVFSNALSVDDASAVASGHIFVGYDSGTTNELQRWNVAAAAAVFRVSLSGSLTQLRSTNF